MTEEPRAKSFKSGNSVAIRIPTSFGVKPGIEFVVVRHKSGDITAIEVTKRKESFMALAGAMSPGFMGNGRGDIEQVERDWSSPDGEDEAA